MTTPPSLHPDLARLIREEIRAGFFCDPPTSRRELPHDIHAQRVVLSSLREGVEVEMFHPPLTRDDFYGECHRRIFDALTGGANVIFEVADNAELETIEGTPCTCGKPLRNMAARLRELAERRSCAVLLQTALARIEVGESYNLIFEAVSAALEALR